MVIPEFVHTCLPDLGTARLKRLGDAAAELLAEVVKNRLLSLHNTARQIQASSIVTEGGLAVGQADHNVYLHAR